MAVASCSGRGVFAKWRSSETENSRMEMSGFALCGNGCSGLRAPAVRGLRCDASPSSNAVVTSRGREERSRPGHRSFLVRSGASSDLQAFISEGRGPRIAIAHSDKAVQRRAARTVVFTCADWARKI